MQAYLRKAITSYIENSSEEKLGGHLDRDEFIGYSLFNSYRRNFIDHICPGGIRWSFKAKAQVMSTLHSVCFR